MAYTKRILEHIYQRPLSKKELNRFYEYERDADKQKSLPIGEKIGEPFIQGLATLWGNIILLDV